MPRTEKSAQLSKLWLVGFAAILALALSFSAAILSDTAYAEPEGVQQEQIDENCVIFMCDSDFGLFTLQADWDGELFYSNDGYNYYPWEKGCTVDAKKIAELNGKYAIFMRGVGNTVITPKLGDNWILSEDSGAEIFATGNIESLLDYETVAQGQHPVMGEKAFYGMFAGCTQLVSAPQLPAIDLSKACYENMFMGCTNLYKCPELPAYKLTEDCYNSMFMGCTTLTDLPVLHATYIACGSYDFMFANCYGLLINAKAPGKPWALPGNAFGDLLPVGMFLHTGGCLCTDAAIVEFGKTYYLRNAFEGVQFLVNGELYESQSVVYGDKIEAPVDPEVAGYNFVGWYSDEECTIAWDFDSQVYNDMVLYAKFVKEWATPAIDGQSYRVLLKYNTNLVLDVATINPYQGSNVSVWNNNKGLNQIFTFYLNDDKSYTITSYVDSNLVLDAARSNPTKGSNVATWSANYKANQRWYFEESDVYEGFYIIRNAADPTLILDAATMTPVKGSNVSVWIEKGEAANQLWTLEPINDLSYANLSVSLMERNYTGDQLEPQITVSLNKSVLEEGVDYVVLYNGVENPPVEVGEYVITIVGIGEYTGEQTVIGEFIIWPAPFATGDYGTLTAANCVEAGLVLDVAQAVPFKGSNVSVWDQNYGQNQEFGFVLGSDGFYTISCLAPTAAGENLVLDAASVKPYRGANVSTWVNNGGYNQKWVIKPAYDKNGDAIANAYAIALSSNPSLVLDTDGTYPNTGDNVTVWSQNFGLNQAWIVDLYQLYR